MAAILERVFEKKVTSHQLRKWLTRNYNKNDVPEILEELCNVRQEFIPYFLNFLRDQSASVLQGCRSANATPSKTPTVLKTQRAITFGEPHAKTSTPRGSGEGKRVQLFEASPAEGDSLTQPLPFSTNESHYNNSSLNFSSFELSRNSSIFESPCPDSQSSNTGPSPHPGSGHPRHPVSPHPGSQGLEFNVSPQPGSHHRRQGPSSGRFPPQESTPSGRRSRTSPFRSFTPDSHRSQHRHSLGDYLVTSSRKKKSPTTARHDEQSHPLAQGNHSSGPKGKNPGGAGGDKKGWKAAPFTEDPGPAFSPEDFPSLGGSAAVKAEENKLLQSRISVETPKDDVVITPSRKVLSSSKSHSYVSQARRSCTRPRRITPTAVSSEADPSPNHSVFKSVSLTKVNESEEQSSGSTVFSVPPLDVVPTLGDERKRLRDAKASKIIPPMEEKTPQKTLRLREMIINQITPTKMAQDLMTSLTEVTQPQPDMVTHSERLQLLSEVYSVCLQGEEEISYLSSVHNAVYFAVAVLAKLKRVISLLDKGTLRLLVDNTRVSEFDLELHKYLVTLMERTQTKTHLLPASSPILGVSFQADTDNRKNFPSDRAFHTFKKQRDQFYELLRDWQENHLQAGWSMQEYQSDRIRMLVGSQINFINHIHFARLFQSQLIQMCKGDRSWRMEDANEENVSLLSELKQTNPDKFKRLQDRFISPQSVGSPCPQPFFPGCQEFFRDFVVVAASHLFNHHLTVTMTSKILELNMTQISQQGSESDQEEEIDAEDVEMLTTCILTLRLLGKFLGFVTFLPYQSPEKPPDGVQSTIISMRNQTKLPIDLSTHIEECRVRGRLIITIPWVVEFLSMMDLLAPRLDGFQLTLSLLVQVYRTVSIQFQKTTGSLTLLMVITMLGWLFELPIFPEEFFFRVFPADSSVIVQVPPDCVDLMDLVNQNIFYTCCPYVGELKALLMGFAVGSNNKGSSVRKITPIHTDIELSGAVCDKQLQHQLEESFFHNHPASMKRTVDFVAERVASNYIKQFRGSHLPRLLQKGTKNVKECAMVMSGTLDSKTKRNARQQVEDLALELANEGQQLAAGEVSQYVQNKIGAILPLMLPDDTSTHVITMTSEICCRLGHDKVLSWMGTHITKSMFLREFSPDLEKRIRYLAYMDGISMKATENMTSNKKSEAEAMTTSKHDETGPFPSDTMISLKDMLRELDLGDEVPTYEEILEQMSAVRWCLENRQDIIQATYKCIGRMVVTLTYFLVIRYPWLWRVEVEEAVMFLCRSHLHQYVTFSNTLCPTNVIMLAASHDDKLSWQKFTELLVTLLQHNLLSPKRLEEDCLNVIEKVSSQYTVKHMSECMCTVAQAYHKRQTGESPDECNNPKPTDGEFVQALDSLSKLVGDDSELSSVFKTTYHLIQSHPPSL